MIFINHKYVASAASDLYWPEFSFTHHLRLVLVSFSNHFHFFLFMQSITKSVYPQLPFKALLIFPLPPPPLVGCYFFYWVSASTLHCQTHAKSVPSSLVPHLIFQSLHMGQRDVLFPPYCVLCVHFFQTSSLLKFHESLCLSIWRFRILFHTRETQ